MVGQPDKDVRHSAQPPVRITMVLLGATLTATLGGLLFGFDTAVIAGATQSLRSTFNLSSVTLGITVSSALWGTIQGTLFAGYGAERWGPRDSLRIMAILYLASAFGCALAWNWTALLAFRILGGVGIGGSSVLGPMYIAEVSPPKVRGRLVSLFQFNIVVGIMLAYLSNYVIDSFHWDLEKWRLQLGVPALPSALFLIFLLIIVRSPRWLVKKGRADEARNALKRIGNADPDAELVEIVKASQAEKLRGPIVLQNAPLAIVSWHRYRCVQSTVRNQCGALLHERHL